MFAICNIVLIINLGGNTFVVNKSDVEGRVVKEESDKYLVDFSEGIKKFNAAVDKSSYKNMRVNKTDCIKE